MGQRMWQTPSAKQECRNCAYMRDLGDGECICGKDPSITVMGRSGVGKRIENFLKVSRNSLDSHLQ